LELIVYQKNLIIEINELILAIHYVKIMYNYLLLLNSKIFSWKSWRRKSENA